MTLDQNFSGATEDFPALLRRKGLLQQVPELNQSAGDDRRFTPTESTTILAFKFDGGVLVAGDRRATSGNTVVYDRADKVLEIDRHSIMAIAGVPATAWEMARVLEHSFQYFRRTQLQEMSVDGKVRALSKLLRDNFGLSAGRRRRRPDFRDLRFRIPRPRRAFIFTMRWARSSK